MARWKWRKTRSFSLSHAHIYSEHLLHCTNSLRSTVRSRHCWRETHPIDGCVLSHWILPGKQGRWETSPSVTVPVCAQTWYNGRWRMWEWCQKKRNKKEQHNWWEGNWTERCGKGPWGAKAKVLSGGIWGPRWTWSEKKHIKDCRKTRNMLVKNVDLLQTGETLVWPS